ncbi:hypothetical protein CWO85_02550 [Candidatus Phytoplasma ziziphi]|uniref:AAA+ ATPase domain-containing protein n=1 Tax=Ziziphus jujuba witches'-broom phytoplasma TaxID=135727 RepID=A0A660HMV5_ZIZJU|nr:ATP-binding protein [Candidatus Phytoplasma ziziphi]AYJ01368.1 hypothetical protein CWO85_02550 [Candidatus Phytoplasma ziziphi]
MSLVKKIYFIWVALLLGLITGLCLYYGLIKKPVVNNTGNQEVLSLIEQRLKKLETKEQTTTTNKTEKVSNQNDFSKDYLTEYINKLTDLQTDLANNQKELQNKTISPDEKNKKEEFNNQNDLLIKYIKELTDLQKAHAENQKELQNKTMSPDERNKIEEENKNSNEQIEQKTQEQIEPLQETITKLKENINKTDVVRLTPEQKKKYLEKQNISEQLEKEKKALNEAVKFNKQEQNHVTKLLNPTTNNEEEKKLLAYKLFLLKQEHFFIQRLNEIVDNKPITDKKKTFKDVYGMQNEKRQFETIINHLKGDEKKYILGQSAKTPKGILLHGPPGTGKTHLLTALSGETGAHYIAFEPSKFSKRYIGEGSEAVEAVWREAERHDKTIIFIDEIDGLPARNNETSTVATEQNTIIGNILSRVEGINSSKKKIILFGATNFLNKVDPALVSRFGQKIKIDSFEKQEIPGFLQWFAIQNKYRLSYHAVNHLENLVTKAFNQKKIFLANRQWVDMLTSAYDRYVLNYHANPDHEVILPSDLDEALNGKLGISKTEEEVLAYRQQCVDQYIEWRKDKLINEKPIITKKTTYGPDDKTVKSIEEYNENNYLIKTTEYFPNGEIKSIDEFNEERKRIKNKNYYDNREIASIHEFNEEGKKIKEHEFSMAKLKKLKNITETKTKIC